MHTNRRARIACREGCNGENVVWQHIAQCLGVVSVTMKTMHALTHTHLQTLCGSNWGTHTTHRCTHQLTLLPHQGVLLTVQRRPVEVSEGLCAGGQPPRVCVQE